MSPANYRRSVCLNRVTETQVASKKVILPGTFGVYSYGPLLSGKRAANLRTSITLDLASWQTRHERVTLSREM